MARHEGHWEHYPHHADMGIRGSGDTPARAFAQAAMALTAVIADPATVIPGESISINVEAPDPELLFVDFLNALIYEMATRKMLFSRFDVHIDGGRLTATISGEKTDVARHQPAVEVKGATYTDLHVGQTQSGEWIAQCVVDV